MLKIIEALHFPYGKLQIRIISGWMDEDMTEKETLLNAMEMTRINLLSHPCHPAGDE